MAEGPRWGFDIASFSLFGIFVLTLIDSANSHWRF